MLNIYVASSWKNNRYERIKKYLEEYGHKVMDWRESSTTFRWSDVDENYENWTREKYIEIINTNEKTKQGFQKDLKLMQKADVCVLLLPCGNSAHLEAGWFIGQNKPTFILLEASQPNIIKPDLMYMLSNSICKTVVELATKLSEVQI